MKLVNSNTVKVMVLGASLVATAAMAQSGDPLLNDFDNNVLSNPQIDVDGTFNKPKVPTMREKLAKQRESLEKRNHALMDKKIETMRMDAEQKLTNKLANAFNGQAQAIDSVSVGQASIVKATVTQPEELKSMRVIPTIGFSAMSGQTVGGEDFNFESKIEGSISFEADVHSHISVGASVGFQALDINDFANNYYSNNYYNSYFTNNWYDSAYGQGREINFKQFSIDLNSKFYFTKNSKFRPYAGLGLGFNRASLSYADNTQTTSQTVYGTYNNYGNVAYGNEESKTSYLSGSVSLGALMNFSSTIGMNLEVSYRKGFTSGFSTDNIQTMYNIDQVRLDEIGSAMIEASVASVKVGLSVSF